MKVTDVVRGLAALGSAKWDLHIEARRMAAAGRPILELTIGEPDQPMSAEIAPAIAASLAAGRTTYSAGQGEPDLLAALAERYSKLRGREFTASQFLAFPGTQTALYALMRGVVQAGDEVILFDPFYATYEGVVVSAGGTVVPVPLSAQADFAVDFTALEAALTTKTKAILVNTPHNPSGAILTEAEAHALGQLAVKHDFWLICDEVYEDLIFGNETFVSPMQFSEYESHCLGCSSISKAMAAPGLRSGWAVGRAETIADLMPLAETMLFGNQPFIADATVAALKGDGQTARAMSQSYAKRAARVVELLDGKAGLAVSRPKAGMFALVNVSGTGLNGQDFAHGLLHSKEVAVMPGPSFGEVTKSWIRLSLTVPDDRLVEACQRIVDFAASQQERSA